MRNVAPTQALSRFAQGAIAVGIGFAALGGICVISGLFLKGVPLYAPSSPSFQSYDLITSIMFFGGGLLAIIGVGLFARAAFWSRNTDNDLARIVGDVLAQRLGKEYTLIRNINKWGTGYIDAVLIGPPGVLVFRILNRQGVFVNEGERWVMMDKKDQWVPANINPTVEAADDIKNLRSFLEAKNLPDVPIFGVVVFIKDDPAVRLTLKDPVMPATHLSSLYNRLQNNYLAKERINMRTVQSIIDKLYDV